MRCTGRSSLATLMLLVMAPPAGSAALAAIQAATASSPTVGTGVLAPWRDAFEAVPLPDLQQLDPAVARQLQQVYDDVRATLADPKVPEAEVMEAYGLLGQLFHAYELLDVAVPCYENASRLAPRDYRWPHLLADLARRRGDLELARKHHEAALAVRPRDLFSLIGRAEACLGSNQPELAEESFRAALTLDPTSTSARAGLGQLALQQRRFRDAVTHLEAALTAVPEANRLRYSLAMAYRGLGDADEARRQLALSGSVGVRTADPLLDGLKDLLRGERVHLVRGRVAYANGRFPEAAAEFAAAVEADPRSTRALVNLAVALSRLGEIDEALERLRQAVALAPENANARFNLGAVLALRGRHSEAVEHLRAAVEANPGDAQAHLALARELHATGDAEAALQHFAEAARNDPQSEDAVLEEASLLVDLERYARAMSVLEAGHRRMPDHGRTMHVLAYLLAACPDPGLRDGARALDLATRVYAAVPDPDHGRTLAAALGELGRCTEAAAAAEKGLSDSKAGGADRARATLEHDLRHYRSGPPCRPPVQLPDRMAPATPP